MTAPNPLPWPAFVLAVWPVWVGLLVVLVLVYADQVAGAAAAVVRVTRCSWCGAWRLVGRPCTTSKGCP